MTKSLAMQRAPYRAVNVVCLSAIDTPMIQGLLRGTSGAVAPAIANRYALRR